MNGSPSLIWDGHVGWDPRPDADLGRLERYRNSGVSYVSLNVAYDVMPWQDAFPVIAAYRAWIEHRSERFVLVGTIADLEGALGSDRLAITFDLEGLVPLADHVDMIAVYHHLGVRQMALAYNRANAFAGGCHDDDDRGLTELGRQAVAEMNRLGVVIDCSHTSHRSTMEAMELSIHPVVFSHSNPRAMREHPRNIRDDQIRACASSGGVVGINGIGHFLGANDPRSETIVRHIGYVAERVGTPHVGIGLDCTFGDDSASLLAADAHFWPPEHYDVRQPRAAVPEQLPEIAGLLGRHGFTSDEVDGIMGENLLRVARAAWHTP